MWVDTHIRDKEYMLNTVNRTVQCNELIQVFVFSTNPSKKHIHKSKPNILVQVKNVQHVMANDPQTIKLPWWHICLWSQPSLQRSGSLHLIYLQRVKSFRYNTFLLIAGGQTVQRLGARWTTTWEKRCCVWTPAANTNTRTCSLQLPVVSEVVVHRVLWATTHMTAWTLTAQINTSYMVQTYLLYMGF